MYGKRPVRCARGIASSSCSGSIASFQVSAGALRKCLAKRASVAAKSAKVTGSSMRCSTPFSSRYFSL